jgi:hypothetical protein
MSISWETDERIRVVIGDAHQNDRDELRQRLLAQPDIDVMRN